MGFGSPLHWIVLLVVVILIFGTKKLGNVGSDLGKAIKGFKDGVKGEEEKSATPTTATPPAATQQVTDKSVVDVEVKEKAKQ